MFVEICKYTENKVKHAAKTKECIGNLVNVSCGC